MSIDSRFSGAQEIFKDLSLLCPERLINIKKENIHILEDSFSYISGWLKDINKNDLKREYIQFSHSLNELISGLHIPPLLHKLDDNTKENNTDSSDNITDTENEDTIFVNNEPKITVSTILHILSNYDLMSAFPNLYLVYKALGTIPAPSATAERSFSKVIIGFCIKKNNIFLTNFH